MTATKRQDGDFVSRVARDLVRHLARAGAPVEREELSRVLGLTEGIDEVLACARELVRAAGLELIEGERTVALGVVPAPASHERAALSPASREVLALVCYLGPVSRAAIDTVRGVNSAAVIRALLEAGLIETVTSTHGEAAFVPSALTLASLGISRVEDLPNYRARRTHLRVLLGYETEEGA